MLRMPHRNKLGHRFEFDQEVIRQVVLRRHNQAALGFRLTRDMPKNFKKQERDEGLRNAQRTSRERSVRKDLRLSIGRHRAFRP
jgi:hypothetical protein